MPELEKEQRRRIVEGSIIGLLTLAFAGLGYYFHAVLNTPVVYTHFAYIPIVLAGLWWQRRGMLIACLLATVTLSLHLLGSGPERIVVDDLARAAFFIIIAFCVGTLSRNVKLGREALRRSEETYRLLIETSLAGLLVVRDGRILFANSRFGEMLGYAPASLIGRDFRDLLDDDERASLPASTEGGRRESVFDLAPECRWLRSDGQIMWINQGTTSTTYDGRPAALVCCLDITARQEAERKQRQLADLARKQQDQLIHSTRLAELGEMAAGIAHELNQPLTGIRNFTSNALYMIDNDAGDSEQIRENLRLVSGQVDRAARIISQMRELARKSEREFLPVDINRAVRESIEFLMPQMRLSGVDVTVELAESLPKPLGDRIRLEQVLLNLLTNARQAMEEARERRLSISTRFEPGSRHSVVIEIADTGRGFDEEEGRRIFAPFFSTKQPGEGTGLGLSISQGIVKWHGGVIEARGKAGAGATFRVRLPLDGDSGLTGESESRPTASGGNPGES